MKFFLSFFEKKNYPVLKIIFFLTQIWKPFLKKIKNKKVRAFRNVFLDPVYLFTTMSLTLPVSDLLSELSPRQSFFNAFLCNVLCAKILNCKKPARSRAVIFSVNKLERYSFLVVYLDNAAGRGVLSYDQKKNEVWKTSDAFWEVSETS